MVGSVPYAGVSVADTYDPRMLPADTAIPSPERATVSASA